MIAVEVYRYSSGSYLEDQDMWRLSGIFRNVTLWSAPQVHIRDFFVKTDLDDQYRDATLEVIGQGSRTYSDQAASRRKLTVSFSTRMASRSPTPTAKSTYRQVSAGQEKSVTLQFPVPNPAKWTAETPQPLHDRSYAWSGNGRPEPTEFLSARTGFRKIEIKGRLFTVNGVPVKLKGANRHENWPDTGHYVSEEKMIRDLEVLKQGNCNHVRTCHYSDDPRWYELCDEWGIYLIAEANVESHGYGYGPDRFRIPRMGSGPSSTATSPTSRISRTTPAWSCGRWATRPAAGPNFLAALKAVKAIDTSRPVHYERVRHRGGQSGRCRQPDVHAPGVGRADRHRRESDQAVLHVRIRPCDVQLDGFDRRIQRPVRQIPEPDGRSDLGMARPGLWNRRDPKPPILAYGGGFGEVPNDHYFIHKGVVFSDRSPKPHYPEMKRAYQWIGIEADDLAAAKLRSATNTRSSVWINSQAAGHSAKTDKVLTRASLETLDLAPGAEQVVSRFRSRKITPRPGAEYFLRISFTLAQGRTMGKGGFRGRRGTVQDCPPRCSGRRRDATR